MIQIDNTIISEDVLEKKFVCNIDKCKGACCIEGDAGAPVDDDEVDQIKEAYKVVKEYLPIENTKAIEEQGFFTFGHDNEKETPLLKDESCAYVIKEGNGKLSCAFEKAYNDGKTNFKKPISCHLFPIRIQEIQEFTAVNYSYWSICDDACILGDQLNVPVYRFLKEPLIRKFGDKWYNELQRSADELGY